MLSLEQYFKLRYATLVGQITALVIAVYIVKLHLPLTTLSLVLSAYLLLIIGTSIIYKPKEAFSQFQFLLYLCIDVLVLDTLLFLSGGATNPFVSLLLLPLVLAAIGLSRRLAWFMAALVIVSYSILMFWYVPLPQAHSSHASPFHMHILGMWFSFIFAVSLIGFFVVKMAMILRRREQEIAEAKTRAIQNEHIIALGTFAAGAAHELGTPLATMAVLAKDMKDECKGETQQRNADILRDQIHRCKVILTQITAQAGIIRAESGRKQRVNEFLDELLDRWRQQRPETSLKVLNQHQIEDAYLLSDATLFQAFSNLLNNAADASPRGIDVHAQWDEKELCVEICDSGSGIPDVDLIDFNQPVNTTKPLGQGLGLFLANSVIKRFGGSLSIYNRAVCGACAKVTLPLNPFENEDETFD